MIRYTSYLMVYKKERIVYNDNINKEGVTEMTAENKETYEQYAKKHKIEVAGTFKDLVEACEEHAQKVYMAENCVDGETETIDCCGECDSYIIGQHRCECGNVRIGLEIEGDLNSGYYHYYTNV